VKCKLVKTHCFADIAEDLEANGSSGFAEWVSANEQDQMNSTVTGELMKFGLRPAGGRQWNYAGMQLSIHLGFHR
jgi:hypothetical protein